MNDALQKEALSHDFFIVASYGATAFVVAGLLFWLIATGRKRRSMIETLAREGGTE